jgi:hypothetical protein
VAPGPPPFKSPKRDADGRPDRPNWDPVRSAEQYYEKYAKKATEALMQFVQALFPGEAPLCVTYFDEAHELELCFWILLRLLQSQAPSTKMWYVFMGTKSSISYYAPTPENSESLPRAHASMSDCTAALSLKLRKELSRLVPPYIALDFDQHAIARKQTATNFRVGAFQAIEHLAQYGRPLYVSFLGPRVPTFTVVSGGVHSCSERIRTKLCAWPP